MELIVGAISAMDTLCDADWVGGNLYVPTEDNTTIPALSGGHKNHAHPTSLGGRENGHKKHTRHRIQETHFVNYVPSVAKFLY